VLVGGGWGVFVWMWGRGFVCTEEESATATGKSRHTEKR